MAKKAPHWLNTYNKLEVIKNEICKNRAHTHRHTNNL